MYEELKRLGLGAVVLAAVVMGCSGTVPGVGGDDGGGGGDAALDGAAPDTGGARVCTRSEDCDPGQECSGPDGCGIPWTCGPALGRPCTDDIAPYCGCDGQTFYGSSSCPPRPFAFRGACATPSDAGPDAPGDCRLPSGQLCGNGMTCPAGDGCNTCQCRGGVLACTGLACVDAGPGPRDCRLSDGRVCPNGNTCPAGDGCNTCRCTNGMLGCTLLACVDAGMPVGTPCANSAQCPAGQLCQGAPGCGVRWTCGAAPGCTRDLVPYCGCNGQTFRASSTCPGQPYAYRGECAATPPDAGVVVCRLPDGSRCPAGQVCPAGPCTQCFCSRDGRLECRNTPGCGVDAGPAGCSLPTGGVCPLGGTCVIDRCTVCQCSREGALRCGVDPSCTPVDAGVDAGPAVDAGPGACRLPNGASCPRFGRCRVDACTICYCNAEGATECTTDSACAVDAGSPVTPCDPQDAQGRGFCDLFLGYRWNGRACEGLSGCSCVGTACGRLFTSRDACAAAYRGCVSIQPVVDAGL